MSRELISYLFRYVLDERVRDELIFREDLLLDQPDVFVRGLLEVPRKSTINPWFFLAHRDAFSSDYYATIEIDVSSKYPN